MSEAKNLRRTKESIERHDDPETREQYLDDYSDDLVVHGADVGVSRNCARSIGRSGRRFPT
jgi:hypothetical protein